MKKIRINNDIDVTVNITSDGSPVDLTGKEVFVWMRVWYITMQVIDFKIDGTSINFKYLADEQKYTGAYQLIV